MTFGKSLIRDCPTAIIIILYYAVCIDLWGAKMMRELGFDDLKEALIRYWDETPVSQNYKVISKKDQKILGNSFAAESIKDCLQNYSWNGSDYLTTSNLLDQLSIELQTAIRSGVGQKVKNTAFDIYKWGGVPLLKKGQRPNKSMAWFEKLNATGELVDRVSQSITILHSGVNLERFDGEDLIMNSGYTKVASLAAAKESLIIMDGRVGAALGDLALIAMREGHFSGVSREIMFPWGSKRVSKATLPNEDSRNPSSPTIKFPRLFGANSDYRHAQAMYLASKLVREVVFELQRTNLGLTERQFECALFMWGYDVRSRLLPVK